MACRGRSNDLDHRPHARMLRVGPVLQRRTPGEQSRRGHVGRSGQWREAARSAARVASSAAGVGVDWCSVRRFRLGSARERARRGTGAPARTSVSVSSAAVRHGAGHAVTRVRGRRRTGAAAPGGGGRAARARPVGHHVHAPAVLGQAKADVRTRYAPDAGCPFGVMLRGRATDTCRPLLTHPTTKAQVKRPGLSSVEVPGIEPGSSVASQGLLRAQSALPLLGPTGHADEPV